jgi:FkbM family methyltransferase
MIGPGDLCFDIGAHVGNRSWVWAGLGARVVALEPQPDLARIVRWLARRRPAIELIEAAVGPRPGTLELHVSRRHPTVSTASRSFLDSVTGAPSFRQVRWDDKIEVPVTTLDALIDRYGRPAFVKIDVEGFEAEVLEGLSVPLPALSFEWLAETIPTACTCVARLGRLGDYRFNATLGETQRFVLERWVERRTILAWLEARPRHSGSGDVYARLAPAS